MIAAVLPVTPLANGMWKWGWVLEQPCKQEANTSQSCTSLPLDKDLLASTKQLDAKVDAAATSGHKKLKPPGTPYKSVDPATGRVWGAPSAFGAGQCFFCPNRAMAPTNRCRSCWRLANTTKYESLKGSDLNEVQTSFKTVLLTFSGKKLEDTEERLQHLYSKLQAGEINPDIQSKLVLIAEAISSGKKAEANKEYACLSAEHWEEHRHWLVALKRLI
jgi:hypothetical protein|eukprot:CAMPEP_0169101894 /NCGR_PEP_ID=MMETSP1015-20121227/21879_1 /TAXON_ID=342587 /ORGANISM="Karlodinium micrum, Strain CCMP2283" /LENGTH=217 /DNA_ID=CAMNT_0009162963 /DNA_START=53 /DNA_END=706 /DNA_ORIENTATION=+